MDLRNKLVSNAVFSYVAFFVARISGFLFITIAFYHVGDNFLGIWFFVMAFIGYFKQVWNSLDQCFIRDFSKENAQYNSIPLLKFINGSFLIMLLVGIIACGIVLFFNYFLIRYFPFTEKQVTVLQAVFFIMMPYVMMVSLTIPLQSLIIAKQKAGNVHIAETIQALLNTLMSILIIYFFPSLKLIILAYFLVQILVFLLLFKMVGEDIIKSFQGGLMLPSFSVFKNQLIFSWQLLLLSFAAIVLFQVDTTIIAFFLPAYFIAIYGTCQKIYSFPMDLSLRISTGILPATSYLQEIDKYESVKELFLLATKYSMIIYFSVGIPLFIYAYPLLRGWFGVEFAENGIWVLRILFFHQWFNINHCIGGYILKGIGKLTELLRYAWICSALNIVISLLLIYKFKLIGVALGTTLPFILFEGYILKHLLRHLAVGFKQYFNNIIFPIYLPIFVVITLCWTFFRVNTLNLIGTILGIILTSVGLFAIYIFSLNRDEKKPLLFFLEKYICVR